MAVRYTLAGLCLLAVGYLPLAHTQGPPDEKSPRPGAGGAKEPQLKKVEFPGGYCDLYLLAQEAVQHDLKLSADQVSKTRELVADLIEKKGTLKFAEHVHQLRKNQQIALDLLKQEQVQRLNQVSFQCMATASFWDPLVRQELQVSDEQFKKVQVVPYATGGGGEKVEEITLIRKDFFDYPKRGEEEWQQREWRRLAVLTPMQRVKWKEMLGKPFKETFPTAVLVPAASRASPVDAEGRSIADLKAEIKTLREKLGQIEKRLSEIEKGRQK